ncbi:hypothetical protein [Buchnera aphidicola]|nr:hypothetical protein [Buchnera aphidicola]
MVNSLIINFDFYELKFIMLVSFF